MQRCWLGVIVPLMVGACGFEPGDRLAIDPPAIYQHWWQATEACAGRRGNFSNIEWYVVEGPSFPCPDGRCLGWWRRDHKIFLAEHWRQHELVVRHEMLHELLRDGDHPDQAFVSRCQLTWESWHARHRPLGRPPPRHTLVSR